MYIIIVYLIYTFCYSTFMVHEKQEKKEKTTLAEQNTRMISARIEESLYKQIKAQDLSIRQLLIKALTMKSHDDVVSDRLARLEEQLRAIDFKVKFSYVAAQKFYQGRS